MKRWISKPPAGIQIDRAHPLARGLVGCWLFNEGEGKRSPDLSNGYFGGLSQGVGRVTGRGLHIPSGSDYFDLGDYKRIKIQWPLSFVLIFTPTTIDGTSNGLISTNQSTNTSGAYMTFTSTTLAAQFGDNTGTGAGNRRTGSATVSIAVNQKYHAVGVIRGVADMSVYLNGIPYTLTYSGTGGATIGYTTGTARIGQFSGNTTVTTVGYIEQALIYNRALTEAEVKWLYTQPYDFMAPIRTGRYAALAAAQQRNLMLLGVGG